MESEQIYSSICYKQNTELHVQSDFRILEEKRKKICIKVWLLVISEFSGCSDNRESACKVGENPWVVKVPCRMEWPPLQ